MTRLGFLSQFFAGSLTLNALEGFGLRLLVGMGTGLVGGYILLVAINRHWIQREYTNIFALAWVLLAFGVADGLVHEAGLLTVIIMGFMLGLSKSEEIKQLKQFKQELTERSIVILFILLSAQLRLTDFANFIRQRDLVDFRCCHFNSSSRCACFEL